MQRAEDVADRLRRLAVATQLRGEVGHALLVEAIDRDVPDRRRDVDAQVRLDGLAVRLGTPQHLEMFEQRAAASATVRSGLETLRTSSMSSRRRSSAWLAGHVRHASRIRVGPSRRLLVRRPR